MRHLAALLGVILAIGCDGSGSETRENGSIVASFETKGLHVLDPDDGTHRAIAGTSGGFEPTWSHDGNRIAFTRTRVVRGTSWEAIVSDLYLVRPDGSAARLVARNAAAPTWSPDGRQVAFMRDICGARACLDIHNPYDLFVLELESANERRLTADERYDGDPSWSPDGNWIAFASEDGLSLIRPDGSGRRRLTRTWDHSTPSWSPDSKQIAFADYVDVYVVDVDGSEPIRLTENGGPDFHPAWSPDGKQIAYLSNHVCARRNGCTAHEPVHIRIMNSHGGNSRALTGDGWGGPSWGSPTGGP